MGADTRQIGIRLEFVYRDATRHFELLKLDIQSEQGVLHSAKRSGSQNNKLPVNSNFQASVLALLTFCAQGKSEFPVEAGRKNRWYRLRDAVTRDITPKWQQRGFGDFWAHFFEPLSRNASTVKIASNLPREQIVVRLVHERQRYTDADEGMLAKILASWETGCPEGTDVTVSMLEPDRKRRLFLEELAIRRLGVSLPPKTAVLLGKAIWFSELERLKALVRDASKSLTDIRDEVENKARTIRRPSDVMALLQSFTRAFGPVDELRDLIRDVIQDAAGAGNEILDPIPELFAVEQGLNDWVAVLEGDDGDAPLPAIRSEIVKRLTTMIDTLRRLQPIVVRRCDSCKMILDRMLNLVEPTA